MTMNKSTKSRMMNNILFEVMKRDPGDELYKNTIPTIRDLEEGSSVFFDIKGDPKSPFECFLFRKDVFWENRHIKILFEDIDVNEFYLGASYIKSYIRQPVWAKSQPIPKYLKGKEYNY